MCPCADYLSFEESAGLPGIGLLCTLLLQGVIALERTERKGRRRTQRTRQRPLAEKWWQTAKLDVCCDLLRLRVHNIRVGIRVLTQARALRGFIRPRLQLSSCTAGNTPPHIRSSSTDGLRVTSALQSTLVDEHIREVVATAVPQ